MAKRPKKKSFKRRVATFFAWCLLILLLVPLGLVAIYRFVSPPITPLMVIRLFDGEGIDKKWVPLDRVSPHVIRAVMALEDTAFCSHSGFDWSEVASAVEDRLKGGRLRGASTISMQTAKNLFLWPDRHIARKALEAPLTVIIETFLDKRRILEIYLNVIEWGPGIYGVEAASRAYFGKSASNLSRREAALLAAVLPNPRRWSPARPTEYILQRAHIALVRLYIVDVGCTRKKRERTNHVRSRPHTYAASWAASENISVSDRLGEINELFGVLP